MDWTQIAFAVLLVAMLFFIFPNAKRALKNAPKASTGDWLSVIKPLAFVVIFVFILILLVR